MLPKKKKKKLEAIVLADHVFEKGNTSFKKENFGTLHQIRATSSNLNLNTAINTAVRLKTSTGQKEETYEDYYSGDHILKMHKSSLIEKLETQIEQSNILRIISIHSSDADIYPSEVSIQPSEVSIQPSEVSMYSLQPMQSFLYFSNKTINKEQNSAISPTNSIRPYSTTIPTTFIKTYLNSNIKNVFDAPKNITLKSSISSSIEYDQTKQKKDNLLLTIYSMTPPSVAKYASAITDKTFTSLNPSKQIKTIIVQPYLQTTSTIILNQTKTFFEEKENSAEKNNVYMNTQLKSSGNSINSSFLAKTKILGKNFWVKFEILRLYTHPLDTKLSEAYQLLKKRTEKAVLELYKGYDEFKGCKVVGLNRIKKDNMTSVEMEIYFTERDVSHLILLQQQLASGKLGDKQTEKEMDIALLNDGITDINWCLPPCFNPYQCYPNCEKSCCALSKLKTNQNDFNVNRQLYLNQYVGNPDIFGRHLNINTYDGYPNKNAYGRYLPTKQDTGQPTLKQDTGYLTSKQDTVRPTINQYGGYPTINNFWKYNDMTINNHPKNIQLKKDDNKSLYSLTNVEGNNFNLKNSNPVYVIYKYIPISVAGSVYPNDKYEMNVAGSIYPNDKYQPSSEMDNQQVLCDSFCKYRCLPACHRLCCTAN